MSKLKSPTQKGFILIGALLMLSLAMSTVCLLISTQNHHKIWHQRVIRINHARSQQNRLIRITHQLMEILMCRPLPDKDDIVDNKHWQTLLEDCIKEEDGDFSIDTNWINLQTDPFEPQYLDMHLTLSLQDEYPGMKHQSTLQGVYCSGRFPLGVIPLLVTEGLAPPVRYDAIRSQVTVPNQFSSALQQADSGKQNWFDPIPLFTSPLGLPDQQPDWQIIGTILGLDLFGPPPPGVYPVRDQEHLKALFIYGDITRMVFSQKENEQKIEIMGNDFEETLIYGADPLYCTLSNTTLPKECQFAQNIIVIGNINSLEQSGTYGIAPFCSLVVFVNGAIHISSSLLSVPPEVPGQKKGSIIFVTGQVLKNPSSLSPDIFVDGKKGIEIDAHLISSGAIQNNCEQLIINGSLNTSTYSGNTPQINFVKPERILPLGPEIHFFQNLFFGGIEEVFNNG